MRWLDGITTQWIWVWVNSRSWRWTGRPGMLRFMGLQRVGHDWATELNWKSSIYVHNKSLQSCLTLCDPKERNLPGFPVHHQLQEFTQTHVHWVVMPSSHLILSCPFLLLPSIPLSIRVFSNVSALLMRWPKYWSFSFSISPSNEHPGLISFRIDWFDLLAVQGTLKSLLQHHSSKASILRLQLSL